MQGVLIPTLILFSTLSGRGSFVSITCASCSWVSTSPSCITSPVSFASSLIMLYPEESFSIFISPATAEKEKSASKTRIVFITVSLQLDQLRISRPTQSLRASIYSYFLFVNPRNGSIPWNHPKAYGIHHKPQAPRGQTTCSRTVSERMEYPQSRPAPGIHTRCHREVEPQETHRERTARAKRPRHARSLRNWSLG